MNNHNDPKRSGRWNAKDVLADLRAERRRNRKLAKDLGLVLVIWLTCAVLWLVWGWAGA